MAHSYPVYTIEAECQDCYKCVRHCPVKAIQVKDGHAAVVAELCVACGRCVEVCPVKAKQVRNDTGRLRIILSENDVPVYVSLAPSWVNEFSGISAGQMIRALKLLGFAGVSETALGAQIVSADVARELNGGATNGRLRLSSACPTAVDFVCKYLPELAFEITQVGSPVMAHCRMLRKMYGDNIKIVFAGPCIGKKNEADRNPLLLNLAITFPELRQMFREAGIVPEHLAVEGDDRFVPEAAEEGAKYPVEGGMNDTLRDPSVDARLVAVSGLPNISRMIERVDLEKLKKSKNIDNFLP